MKKGNVITVCMVLVLLVFCFGQAFAASCGDVNSSGGVDIVDALLIAQYYVGLNPGNFDFTVADVNGDSAINIVDALRVAQYYVGIVTELTCGAGSNGTPGPTETPNPACTTGPTPITVNVTTQGAPFTGSHQVVVETDPGISGVTIFRPKDLGAGKMYPILAWGQGGCSLNGTYNPEFLGEIASHGYLVFSDGAPNGSGSRNMGSDLGALGQPMLDYIGWAIKENDNPCSQYYQSLDPGKTAVFGWSCGGLMSLGASGDPRLTTVILNSSGLLSADQNIYNGIHTPIAFICGSPDDMAYANSQRDFENINNVPILFAAYMAVGHEGTYTQDNGGSFAKVDLAWLDWWLKGDTGATGKGMFVGANCGLCNDPNWTLQSKNIQ
jgi:hypothetical protein